MAAQTEAEPSFDGGRTTLGRPPRPLCLPRAFWGGANGAPCMLGRRTRRQPSKVPGGW